MIIKTLENYAQKVRENFIFLCITLSIFVFFTSLVLSSSFYYSGKTFDWKSAVISDLQSPIENPNGFIIAALGTTLTGIILAPTVVLFHSKLYRTSKVFSTLGTIAFSLGILGTLIIGCLTPFPKSYEPIHIPIAFATFISIVMSILIYCSLIAYTTYSLNKILGLSLVILGLFKLSVLIALFYLYLTPGFFTNDHLITTLALWEWLLCISIVVYLLLLTLILKKV